MSMGHPWACLLYRIVRRAATDKTSLSMLVVSHITDRKIAGQKHSGTVKIHAKATTFRSRMTCMRGLEELSIALAFFCDCRTIFSVTCIPWTGCTFDDELALCRSFSRDDDNFSIFRDTSWTRQRPNRSICIAFHSFHLGFHSPQHCSGGRTRLILYDKWTDMSDHAIKFGEHVPEVFISWDGDQAIGFSLESGFFMKKLPLTTKVLVTQATRSAY